MRGVILIQKTIKTLLSSSPAVTALVGTRIFPIQLPLDCEFPAVSYIRISDRFKHVVGSPRFQISCWGETFLDCLDLENAVMDALEGYSGIVNGVTVERIVPEGSRELFNSDAGVFHIPIDFKVIYRK